FYSRKNKLLENIKILEEKWDYTKEAEFLGEVIIIEELLGNSTGAKSYRQKQIDIAVKGLDYIKDQYVKESKKAAISEDYSKALELYKESQLISKNLKIYLEKQESVAPKEDIISEIKEPSILKGDLAIVYSCINYLLTKYLDEIGIKYYSNPQINDNIENQIHGLILNEKDILPEDIDPSIRDKIKAIQIIYIDNISNENILRLIETFQNQNLMLMIVGVKWPKNIESLTFDIPVDDNIKFQQNIKIIHHELFARLVGLKETYEVAFKEIIDLYNISELNILQKSNESSTIKLHGTEELLQDLKVRGLVKEKLEEYFYV
ncbi:hypothetical protein LCGC14_2244570, partial [marine sediment metagenome]